MASDMIWQVDEHEHGYASYNPSCELSRVYNMAIAVEKPLILVRFNPDEFKINGLSERVPKAMRHALLLEVLKEHFARGATDFITVAYICYSQPARLMNEETRPYVTTMLYPTMLDYEAFVGSAYPDGCAAPAAGTPWYAKQD